MKLRFFGATGCIPDRNDDSPCYILNDKYCFDCGWALTTNLINFGYKPSNIKHLFFTHMHHDHYLSLPTLLFYYMQTGEKLNTLNIYGPKNEVEPVVKLAMDFLQGERYYQSCRDGDYPNVIGLCDGDKFQTEDFEFSVIDSLHPVPGLCYRATEKSDGKSFGTTGDTTFRKEYGEFFKNCDALAHETTLCVCKIKDQNQIASRHSSVYDAVETANSAQVKTLFVMHGPLCRREEVLDECEKIFNGKTVWPEIGKEYEI